jgi:F0F1-type ATP synthase delta subunit
MDQKLIAQLVEKSFKNNELDREAVLEIAERLTKSHLREYIKQLKKYIATHTVIVETAYAVTPEMKKSLEELYKDKKVEYRVNEDILLGIKIYENDIIFSKNLKDTLTDIKNYLVE